MSPTKWAILVGNSYIPPAPDEDEYEPGPDTLNGCVSDVKRIRAFLQDSVGFSAQNVFELTADGPPPAGPTVNVQIQHMATYANVLRIFEIVTTSGRPGDTVYVHFSTGSSRQLSVLSRYDNRRHDRALLLLDNDGGRHFLHGLELAVLVSRLLKAGLDVTVTVDAREVETSGVRLRESVFSQAELAAQFHGYIIPEDRDNTLVNPDMSCHYVLVWMNFVATVEYNYTVTEYRDPESGQRYGLLSHFLLYILSRYGLQVSWSTILRLLQSEISAYRQYIERRVAEASVPGLSVKTRVEVVSYGRKERLFLEGCHINPAPVPLLLFPAQLVDTADRIYLKMDAGKAHTVIQPGMKVRFISRHDEETRFDPASSGDAFVFEVTSVQEFCCLLRPLNALPMSDPARARMKDIVHGAARVLDAHSFGFRPQSLAAHLQAYSSRLNLSTNDDEFRRQINVFPVGGYRYSGTDDAHPAPCPTITSDGRIHLLSGDYATIVVSIMSPHAVFLHMLYFDSAFGITQICPEPFTRTIQQSKLLSGYFKSHFSVRVRLWSPPDGPSNPKALPAMSYIKMILTSTPTSFHSLELAPIVESVPPSSMDHNNVPKCRRVAYGDANHLGLCLHSRLIRSTDDENPLLHEKWCSFNVAIAVHDSAESLARVARQEA
ncbi:hypothetical protein BDW71DRAFT_185682 [Aspergillus fruticulosus]